jgi:endonuclease YncB( thermonuclease family)
MFVAAISAAAVVAAPSTQIASTSTSDVVVIDGSTIAFHGRRIRLADVAAPTTAQQCDLGRGFSACGAEVKGALAQLVAGKTVVCKLVGVQRSAWAAVADDLLGRCWIGRLDIAAELVDAGLVIPGPGSPYAYEGLAACMARRGLWAGSLESPWTFRARHGGQMVAPVMIGALAKRPCVRAIEAPNLR